MSSRRLLLAAAVAFVVLAAAAVRALTSGGSDAEVAPILREFEDDGTEIPSNSQPSLGEAELERDEDGLTVRAEMGGLIPNGAYTFWLVVYQGDGEFPDDIYVNYGKGAVADDDGRAEASMQSSLGETSIPGFYVQDLGGEADFSPLVDPLNGRVRVEVVYHGQADVAGDDLDAWLADFWTGDPDICANPLGTVGTSAVPDHPYCPGYFAATFDAADEGPSRAA